MQGMRAQGLGNKGYLFYFILLFILSSQLTFAGQVGSGKNAINPELENNLSLRVGVGVNTPVALNPSDYYLIYQVDALADNEISHNPVFRLGLFKHIPASSQSQDWLQEILVGLEVIGEKQTRSGHVLINSSPNAWQYNYKLGTRIINPYLSGELHFKAIDKSKWHSFVSAGVGVNFAQVSYAETTLSGVPDRPEGHVPSRAESLFSFNLGAGVIWAPEETWQLGLQYMFRYLGTANTSSLPDESPISVKMSSHNVFLTLDYKI